MLVIKGGGVQISPEVIADALRRRERVEIHRSLDNFARMSLQEEVGKLIKAFVELVEIGKHRNGHCCRYRVRTISFQRLECSLDRSLPDDLDGHWVELDPKEVALATVIA